METETETETETDGAVCGHSVPTRAAEGVSGHSPLCADAGVSRHRGPTRADAGFSGHDRSRFSLFFNKGTNFSGGQHLTSP